MKKIFLIMMLLMLMVPLFSYGVLAATPLVDDGVCRNDLGEDRVNSPNDCKPDAQDYLSCYLDKESCIDDKTWNEVVIGLSVFIVILALLWYNKSYGGF